MISLAESRCEVTGRLFSADVTASIRHRIGVEVEGLAVEGQRVVRSYLAAGIKDWTGETARIVEAHSYATGMHAAGSLFAKVRMEPGQARDGDAERPYIIAHVLESGGYGGQKLQSGDGKRRKTKWQRGTRQQRRAIHEFRNAYRTLKARAAAIRADLTRGLDG